MANLIVQCLTYHNDHIGSILIINKKESTHYGEKAGGIHMELFQLEEHMFINSILNLNLKAPIEKYR